MKPRFTLLWVLLFAIAMGYLESAVVVYIRELYYPEGFAFPMKVISRQILITEIWRELATMIMLLGMAVIAGKNTLTRFAYFIYAFAVWDIFYYVFLWALIGWPQSFFTWDLLFFIPTVWTGPVIAPLINCGVMIFLAIIIIYRSNRSEKLSFGWLIWTLLIAGSVLVFVAYTKEYTLYMLQRYSFAQLMASNHPKEMLAYGISFMPQHFPWFIFLLGVKLHLWAVGIFLKQNYSFRYKNYVCH